MNFFCKLAITLFFFNSLFSSDFTESSLLKNEDELYTRVYHLNNIKGSTFVLDKSVFVYLFLKKCGDESTRKLFKEYDLLFTFAGLNTKNDKESGNLIFTIYRKNALKTITKSERKNKQLGLIDEVFENAYYNFEKVKISELKGENSYRNYFNEQKKEVLTTLSNDLSKMLENY